VTDDILEAMSTIHFLSPLPSAILHSFLLGHFLFLLCVNI
jgi:hypothetical protein